MPELKRLGQSGKMNTDFHERILPAGEYREALNVNVGRSETSEVGTIENLLGNQVIGDTGITGGVCIGSYRDNERERIFYFVTNNNSFDEGSEGEHGIFLFNQINGKVRQLVSGSHLNFHVNFSVDGINLLEDLLFWTDNRNEPRKINVDTAINNSSYYSTDVLMTVAKPAPFNAATITTTEIPMVPVDPEDPSGPQEPEYVISSTFLEDKLPRFSYRWQFEDGEYSVLAPFTPIVFSSNATDISGINVTRAEVTGEFSDFTNSIKFARLSVPITSNAGIVSVELLYKDTRGNTVYILEEQQVTASQVGTTFDYLSQDPFRAIPNSQVVRVSDAVPRQAKSQEVAGGRIVYGNYLQNYNLPPVDFNVEIQDGNTNPNLQRHSVKTRRTYQVGIVLADEFGRTTPVILSNNGSDTIFVSNSDLASRDAIQLNIQFPTPSQLEGFHSYKVVVKQTQQEYYNWFTNAGSRSGDGINKIPVDQTAFIETIALARPSSASVYVGDNLRPVTVQNTSQVASIDGVTTATGFFETNPFESELNIFYETSTGGVTSAIAAEDRIAIEFYNCYVITYSGSKLEANRIRLGFNEQFFDVGVRAHAINEEFAGEERRSNALIHSSGLFNSRTGLNQLNQFSESAGGITLSLDPSDGSIQKLYAEDTQLIIWQEDKVSRSPIDKDFIYSAEGGAVPVTSNSQYLGTIAPYTGEYGISTDPESFAVYGTRKYFTDRNRGVVIRLSNDGISEISTLGMSDFFRDALRDADKIIGSFDEYHNTYNITISGNAYDRNEDTNRATASEGYFTIGFEEDVKGWVSFKSFQQESGTTLNNRYYTFNGGNLWEHNREDAPRNNFYGKLSRSYVDFIFNDSPSNIKQFNTLGYEGESGWKCGYIETEIDHVGDLPSENENYAEASLNINVVTGEAENTSFSGETTNVVPTDGDTAGQTEWIVVVSPISTQYSFIDDETNENFESQLTLSIDGNAITGDDRRLTNGDFHFRVTEVISGDSTLTVDLGGDGARLAFSISLLTINVVNNVTNSSLNGDIAREFFVENIDEVEEVIILADTNYYLDESNITVDTSGISSFLQTGLSASVANLDEDDVRVLLPIRTPSDPVGVATLNILGSATLKPLLTWEQTTSQLFRTANESFSRLFNVGFPISPRDDDSLREGIYTFTVADSTIEVFEVNPVLDTNAANNITLVSETVDNETGTVSLSVRSTIDTESLTSEIVITGTSTDAVITLADETDADIEYDDVSVTPRTGTSNTPVEAISSEDWAEGEITEGDGTAYTIDVTTEVNDEVSFDPRTTDISIAPVYTRLTGVATTGFTINQTSSYSTTVPDRTITITAGDTDDVVYNVQHLEGIDISSTDVVLPSGVFGPVISTSTLVPVGGFSATFITLTPLATAPVGDHTITVLGTLDFTITIEAVTP